MYNWQHDGHQKNQLYGEEGKCPMGCGANETHMHYLHCTDEDMIKYRESRLKILNQKLRKIKTYDGIRIILLTILRHGLTHPDIITKHHCTSDQLIEMAINEQKK